MIYITTVLLSITLVYCIADELKFSRGNYGCNYSKSLCKDTEICVNDGLFGSCQNVLSKADMYKYNPSTPLKSILEAALTGLLELDYTWYDDYTQCIVSGLLESYRLNISPELAYCDEDERRRLLAQQLQKHLDVGNIGTMTDEQLVLLRDYFTGAAEETTPSMLNSEPLSIPTVSGLSQDDIRLLNQLVHGTITVNELTTAEIRRLKNYLQMALGSSAVKGTTLSLDNSKESLTSHEKTTPISSVQESDMEEILLKFSQATAPKESQISNSAEVETGAERLSEDILGQQITDQLRQMEHMDINQYVDKKSESHILGDKDETTTATVTTTSTLPDNVVDTSYAWILLDKSVSEDIAENITKALVKQLELPLKSLQFYKLDGNQLVFLVSPSAGVNASRVAELSLGAAQHAIKDEFGVKISKSGIGRDKVKLAVDPHDVERASSNTATFVIVAVVTVTLAVILILVTWSYMYRKWNMRWKKAEKVGSPIKSESTQDNYEDLCRQRMQNSASEASDSISPLTSSKGVRVSAREQESQLKASRSPRSSTSSWSEEPVSLTLDISTGHTILSYMEDHLKNTERLDEEWGSLCSYVPDQCTTVAASINENKVKNRYLAILPYDHNRVTLKSEMPGEDYVNASFIADHDPRQPDHITTQGPLTDTAPVFWQMVWEQDCTAIVMLTALEENHMPLCYQYWPSEGRQLYGNYEVHLVSEHIWCEDYLVRSFYLKNVETNQTRTVTQFHYLTWQDGGVPTSCKELLDFRRKVNKSYRGKASPTIVCCSDGSGRSGTYILLDMVISRLHKGAKEIDIAASLEHIRDQRMNTVQTREQFEFVLAAVAEEVQALLHAMPQ